MLYLLCSILRDKSQGVPSWCEQLLREMLYDGVIKVEPLVPEVHSGEAIVEPPKEQLMKRRRTIESVENLVVSMINIMLLSIYT